MRRLFIVLAFLTFPFLAKAQGSGAIAVRECNFVSAATTNATSCTANPGRLFGIAFYNTTATLNYLRIYNLSTAPTCSSATGFIKSIPIQAAAASNSAGTVYFSVPRGVGFTPGLAFCLTGGSSSTDNTAGVVGIFGTLFYAQN